jgi:hypothetical protein
MPPSRIAKAIANGLTIDVVSSGSVADSRARLRRRQVLKRVVETRELRFSDF